MIGTQQAARRGATAVQLQQATPASAPAATGDLRLTPVATYKFSIATRRMEPYDERDDLGLRQISLAVYRRFQPVIAPNMPSAPYTPPIPPNTTVGGPLPA